MSVWDAPSVITIKRDGGTLPPDAIRWFIQAYTDGRVADEQAASLCMAIFLNGLDADELVVWTEAMIESGERADLSAVGRPTVDKHSTGGVGDKISLPLAPLVAAAGAAVPQLGGRGLGHTGGTIDKMEAIHGWSPDLSSAAIVAQLRSVGAIIAAATPDLAPADRKLYALRDVTATVDSIPLIASSIMSKKIAEGTESLVLDVKVGSGAFMTDLPKARRLAETMVGLGERAGVRTVALLTRMDQPLGAEVGNASEVRESLDTLRGEGPADVAELTVALAAEMLDLAGVEGDAAALLASGETLPTFEAMVSAQGGDLGVPMAEAAHTEDVVASTDGHLVRLEARSIGLASMALGAGRTHKDEPIASFGAGITCLVKEGEPVAEGQPILRLRTDDPARFEAARARLTETITVGPEAADPGPVVIERIS